MAAARAVVSLRVNGEIGLVLALVDVLGNGTLGAMNFSGGVPWRIGEEGDSGIWLVGAISATS